MGISKKAMQNYNELFDNEDSRLYETDADFVEIYKNFVFDEVPSVSKLDKKIVMLLILTSMIASKAPDSYMAYLPAALKSGVTPVMVKEMVYHCVPYCGLSAVYEIISLTNERLLQLGYELPVESRTTTTSADRLQKGLAIQRSIFGATIDKMRQSAPLGQQHIQDFLSDNCFGDYYTRDGLDVKTRELITYVILISIGGCEPQVKAHVSGNAAIGNGKDILVDVTTQLLPYIGYPRTLNAFSCINAVLQ